MDELFGVLEELDALLNSGEVVEESHTDNDDDAMFITAFESEDAEEVDTVEETDDIDTDDDADDDDDNDSEFDDDCIESLMIDDDI